MKIAVFGAAFDPPHLGHQQIVTDLIEKKQADQVWLLPVRYHEFGKNLSSDEHRLKMLDLLLESIGLDQVRVEEYEMNLNRPSPTYESLEYFSKKHPEHQFSFVIGADNLARFHQWDHYQELLKKYPVWVYPRPNYPLAPLLSGMRVLSDVEPVAISSTLIKKKIAEAEVIDQLVPSMVSQYIQQEKLYHYATSHK